MKDLKLAWVWAMRENVGANQPQPIVHNGTLYLVNPGNTVQALEASTGDLIWEHEIGPMTQLGQGAMRNFAIYQDKVIVATTDARLVALDARNGKLVWQTEVARALEGVRHLERSHRRARQGHSGDDRLHPVRTRSLLHQRVRREHRQAAVEVPHHRPDGGTRGRHLGQVAGRVPQGR